MAEAICAGTFDLTRDRLPAGYVTFCETNAEHPDPAFRYPLPDGSRTKRRIETSATTTHIILGTTVCREGRSESATNPTTAVRKEPGTLDELLDTIINAEPVPTGGDASTGLSPGTKFIIILLLYLILTNSILVVSSVTI
ncbi:hypothetical protein F5J12DRAFT_784204 [Pisolithus orientalis]|uniref:uncharacterized protein n=1 Tax=Pisolithus orientalis TaxID=936130 RepID=UPI0022251E5D|nr:uncharacterized protein F5J12DRAFT_784204 [Pisolithus orientalis]KAI6000952.1 hypothetical protein F5J12DRAFT_784204 [Pisolithus orientalis]